MAKIGTGQITLADLTDERPVRLDLSASLEIIQSQTGNVYDPDYSIGDGQVITPSLFFGNSEAVPEDYLTEIHYNCSDEGDEKDYIYNSEFDPSLENNKNISYVDNYGRFHLRRNLNDSIVIEANVNKVIDKQTGVEYSSFSERITLHKVSYESGYSAFIISKDGRYNFEGSNSDPIILSSELYYGASLIEEDKIDSRNWYKSASSENSIGNGKTYQVNRTDVSGYETFICEIKLKGGLIFRAQIGINDRVDSFYNVILSEGETILTPLNNRVELNCQIWKNNEIYNGESSEITYNWYYIENNKPKNIQEEFNGKSSFSAILDGDILPKQSITLYCQTEIKENNVVIGKPINFIPIQYTNPYTATLTPDIIFIPANSDGSFKGIEFEKEISLEIRGENGELLPYNNSSSSFFPPSSDEDEGIIFEEIDPDDSSVWRRTFKLKINKTNKLGEWDSKNFRVEYKYLNIDGLVKTFDILKNYQGEQGEQGFSSFTVDLTNSFHKFAGEERWAIPGQNISFSYIGKIANNELDLQEIKIPIGDEDYLLYSTNSPLTVKSEVQIEKGLYLTYSHPNFTLFTQSRDNTDYLETLNGSFNIKFTFSYSKLVNDITIIKSFNYGFTKTGNSYSIYTDPTNIVYSPATNSFNYPSISIVSQYQSGGMGALSPYPNAGIWYSFDNDNFTKLSLENGSGSILTSLLTPSMKQITIRFYTSQSESLPDNDYLVDIETIPIITSLDGTEIGGENLIPWSKSLSLEEERWSYEPKNDEDNDYFTLDLEENFGVMSFKNLDEKKENPSLSFSSPKISLEKYYIDKIFSFSCLIFSEAWEEIKESIDIELKIYQEIYDEEGNLTSTKISSGTIGSIFSDIDLNTINFQEDRENGQWQKIYKTFKFENSFFPDIGSSDLNSYSNFNIIFTLKSLGSFKIKKPKLELGSFPTDWSINFKDNEILINDIEQQLSDTGANLQNQIVILSDQQLTLSSNSQDINLSVIDFISGSSLEDTSISLTPITIQSQEGDYTFLNLAEFQKYIKELNKENATQIRNYSTSLITEELREYKSRIDLHPATSDDPEGYISIKSAYFKEEGTEYLEAMRITSNRLSFYVNNEKDPTAYMSNNKLFIPHGQITESLIIGREIIKEDEDENEIDSHLKIFTSDNGIGFIWEEL